MVHFMSRGRTSSSSRGDRVRRLPI